MTALPLLAMKKFFPLRALLLSLLVLLTVSQALAQETFRIVSVRPTFSNDLIKVGKDWRKNLQKRIQVTLQVQTDTPASSVFVHAYFYDKDDHLVDTCKGPNAVWTSTPKGIQEVLLPATLPGGKVTEVYFALPEELQAKKWTTVLAVFGVGEKVVVQCMPASELPKLDFPEKAKLTPTH